MYRILTILMICIISCSESPTESNESTVVVEDKELNVTVPVSITFRVIFIPHYYDYITFDDNGNILNYNSDWFCFKDFEIQPYRQLTFLSRMPGHTVWNNNIDQEIIAISPGFVQIYDPNRKYIDNEIQVTIQWSEERMYPCQK